MQKAKKYNWKDSNMSLFGSDTDKKVKKESAQTEPAWQGVGEKVGLEVWRINKFKVEHWPKRQQGEFFNGDSYIVLNTYKEGNEIKYDVHFWIGKYSTQDEYGTAAYKTVELDTFLDDKAVQHREVQGSESNLFKSYFPNLTLLKGGADSGFHHVVPEKYTPRLFHVQRQAAKNITISEVSLKLGNIKDDDVFILDLGNTIYQYNGPQCSNDEQYSAAQYVAELKAKRGKVETEIVEKKDLVAGHVFYDSLKKEHPKKKQPAATSSPKVLLKVSADAGGKLEMEEVARGPVTKNMFESEDVFIYDTGNHIYCWIGKKASVEEKRNAMPYACNYTNNTDHPCAPISVISEGKEPKEFSSSF